MKVLRIFGIVAFVHAFAFLLIMANPGCSTKPKPAPTPASTETTPASSSPALSVPTSNTAETPALGAAPQSVGAESSGGISFDPNATAISVPRYSPTRPGTPASTALQAEPVTDVTPATTISVGKGDSLWSIAKKHNIPVADLAAANNLKTGATLRVGQKLVVPGKALGSSTETASAKEEATPASPASSHKTASTVETPAAKVPAAGGVKHIVKPGETLAVIARKYGVKAGDVAVANNITNPAMIRAGKELVIPGWQAPKSSGKGGAAETPAGEGAPAAKATSKTVEPLVMPKIGLPSPEQDLDAGLKPATNNSVPVIKLEDNAPVPTATKN